MSRNIEDLQEEFQPLVKQLLKNCENNDVSMRLFFTVRDPITQAKLWRQSRAKWQIDQKINQLNKFDCHFLAECIKKAGPQNGRWATNAIPGLSWHQHGYAIDAFWLVNNRSEWSTRKEINGINGYAVYAEQAKLLGLNAGHFWRSRDSVHVQMHAASSPLKFYDSIKEINDIMEDQFSHLI